MKKRIWIIIAVILAVLMTALIMLRVSCRRITVVSGKQFVDKCPAYAFPGQEVTVTTAVVSDGDIFVNGADGSYIRPGVYVFTMPDEDVQLKVTILAYPGGA